MKEGGGGTLPVRTTLIGHALPLMMTSDALRWHLTLTPDEPTHRAQLAHENITKPCVSLLYKTHTHRHTKKRERERERNTHTHLSGRARALFWARVAAPSPKAGKETRCAPHKTTGAGQKNCLAHKKTGAAAASKKMAAQRPATTATSRDTGWRSAARREKETLDAPTHTPLLLAQTAAPSIAQSHDDGEGFF